jgi:hypothetical protein
MKTIHQQIMFALPDYLERWQVLRNSFQRPDMIGIDAIDARL